jgi:HD superfamily phosphohydrolase
MAAMRREIRDPIHNFVKLDEAECRVLDSRPFQRLRHIHQLATTYLVYPGATHRRFEHSLGVMELAGRVFDVITDAANLGAPGQVEVRSEIERLDHNDLVYWRRVLRLAALCHDVGHLPFSHAAEEELLPAGVDHETLTVQLIKSRHLAPIFEQIKIRPDDVAKLSVGRRKYERITGQSMSAVEELLAEIIVGDAFGVDRMDYLLRDAHHAGVAYGRFDHERLIDTLRLLPKESGSTEPWIGVEEGGLHSVLGLAYARYFMYLQVYFHRVRRAYDVHLKQFLAAWLADGRFSTDLEDHLAMTDNEVMAALSRAARDESLDGHEPARRLLHRHHLRLLYERREPDVRENPDIVKVVGRAAAEHFGAENVVCDLYEKSSTLNFPVLQSDGQVRRATAVSGEFLRLPEVKFGFVFVTPECRSEALEWLTNALPELLHADQEEDTP